MSFLAPVTTRASRRAVVSEKGDYGCECDGMLPRSLARLHVRPPLVDLGRRRCGLETDGHRTREFADPRCCRAILLCFRRRYGGFCEFEDRAGLLNHYDLLLSTRKP